MTFSYAAKGRCINHTGVRVPYHIYFSLSEGVVFTHFVKIRELNPKVLNKDWGGPRDIPWL